MNEFEEIAISDLKECSSCLKEFDLNQFYTKGKNRYESICKVCSKKKKTKRYRMKITVNKRKETIGIKSIELVPTIENYKLKILRGL
jgi:hypothetical protein